jgi:hypothetical protein
MSAPVDSAGSGAVVRNTARLEIQNHITSCGLPKRLGCAIYMLNREWEFYSPENRSPGENSTNQVRMPPETASQDTIPLLQINPTLPAIESHLPPSYAQPASRNRRRTHLHNIRLYNIMSNPGEAPKSTVFVQFVHILPHQEAGYHSSLPTVSQSTFISTSNHLHPNI